VYLPLNVTTPSSGYQITSAASPLFHIPTIVEYRSHFEKASGINAPKILFCVTSMGTVEKQVLKSNDDMRQDALIEQVFSLTNTLLYTHHYEPTTKVSHHRGGSRPHDAGSRANLGRLGGSPLHIWTYQVIPLGPTTGILQWVNDTMTLGHYLVGSLDGVEAGAHARYFPEEWNHANSSMGQRHNDSWALPGGLP